MDIDDYYDDYDDTYEILHCYCKEHCPSGDEEGICQVTFGGKCFTSVEILTDDYGYDYPFLSHGCFGADETGLMQCKANLVPHAEAKTIQCCDDGDFCNKNLLPADMEKILPPYSYFHGLPLALMTSSVISCVIVIFVVAVVFVVYRRKEKLAMREEKNEGVNNNEVTGDGVVEGMVGRLSDLIEQSTGSGSGLPMMVQRTIAKQIEMGASIGKGRFGEVWLGKWREERVAVKIFLSTEEKSWMRETEIYQTVLMRHENILGFVAADIKGAGGWTQLLLITEYHERGSLYDFLQNHTLNPDSLLTMCLSIVRGLGHLHNEIFGIHGKPSIAHRDVKSKNILVKRNGECCIADFGMAVKYQSSANKLDVPVADRCGTKRYMAPEILDGRIDLKNFDAHKSTDMYACGLVFWEMAKRCDIIDYTTPAYTPPFYEEVSTNPSFEELQEAICVRKVRPTIPASWDNVEILQTLAKTMQELWHENPAVRLTALRVKKTLNKLRSSDVAIEIQ